ncbi:EpsG family protein [Hyunsoonleella ulvae]|uniref:EpsG family protein n=1 Tax=Hyunsoonleella ulvae TaxID=2799948 RepID=UPI00193A9EB5|nr:EpsG family protein [Hyunsoonleella ulvae]
MIDFIPLDLYYDFYINLMLIATLLVMVNGLAVNLNDSRNIGSIQFFGYLILFFLIFYVGLRPISGRFFGDMSTYAKHFRYYINGGEVKETKDVLFHYFMKICSNVMGIHAFFTTCCFLYVFPLFKLSKKLFDKYWFYAFFMFTISFSFWTYGTNGIRNGMATSFFLWALAYRNNKVLHIVLMLLSIYTHKTLLLPVLIYAVTFYYNNPKLFFYFWVACIPLSLVLGGFWENLFASLGFADDRFGGYLVGEKDEAFANSGFRWDFLIYSSGAVAVGFYFIIKRGFSDVFYNRIFSTYILANSFWVLVIRANFSNRFAYLSWFIMGLVIIYPFLKQQFFKNQHLMISKTVLAYFSFTYFMSYIYYAFLR